MQLFFTFPLRKKCNIDFLAFWKNMVSMFVVNNKEIS